MLQAQSFLLEVLSLKIAIDPNNYGFFPEAMKKVAGTFGWNSSVVLAVNYAERGAAFHYEYIFRIMG